MALADARRKAAEYRAAVADGRNPLAEKRRSDIPMFRDAAQAVYDANRPRWRIDKHTKLWWASLENHVFPVIGDMRVDRITQSDVLKCVEPNWTTRPEAARKARQRIRTTLRRCQAHGFVTFNVAGEVIDGALPPMPRVQSHFRSLPYQEVAEALDIVDHSGASEAAKLCLRFVVLTAARSGEARNAVWDEVEFSNCEWQIPATRMKAANEHRVPMSDAALEVLQQAKSESHRPLRRHCRLWGGSITAALLDLGKTQVT